MGIRIQKTKWKQIQIQVKKSECGSISRRKAVGRAVHPDPHSDCGSRSRREKLKNYKITKVCVKVVFIVNMLKQKKNANLIRSVSRNPIVGTDGGQH